MSEAIRVAGTDDIGEGEAMVVPGADNVTGVDIAVFHTQDGEFFALDNMCTHGKASLAEGWIEDGEVECPLHAANFDLATGKALCLPATTDARTHKVEVRGADVFLFPGEPAQAG